MIIKWILNHLTFTTFLFFAGYVLVMMYRKEGKEKQAKKLVKKAILAGTNEPLTLHPEVDSALCLGCGSCTRVCPEGDILKLINNKATLVAPTKCVGHGECETACPTSAITLVFGTKARGMEIPRVSSNYETNVAGIYIAGELGGMGLIRNAIKQGTLAGKHAVSNLAQIREPSEYDILIIGAGPAGLAASLSALQSKKRYLCIEQSSLGGTVYNFPRQKVVMTQPAELPITGKMSFPSNKVSKESLLEYWQKVVQQTGLKISEDTKFESLEKTGEIFHVKTSKGTITTKKVILCMGVRGSPRKLGLPNEDLPKVTYNLLDPEQYQNCNIAVIGGGNAGVEAAQYLGKKAYNNKVTLMVRGPTFDRCNEENQTIIQNMATQGLVNIWFNSSTKEIHKEKLVIEKEGSLLDLPNDYLFVFAGAEMPHKFLMSLGVQIEKKFGEKLSS